VALLLALVGLCDRYRLNRMFTVGFARWAARRRQTRNVGPALAPAFAAMPSIDPPKDQPRSGGSL
jgi:hypothetical protein